MKRVKWGLFSAVMLILLGGCNLPDQQVRVFSISYLFFDADEGWRGDFADYPEGDSVTYQLKCGHDFLPVNLNANMKAIYMSGDNGSDDLFMFLKKKISGLRPNTTYLLLFNVKVASNARTGVPGAGGAPGESVYVKVGASVAEPKKQLVAGMYRMNIDKGNQDSEGTDMINIGHVGVSSTTTQFTVINRNNSSVNPFEITTDSEGEIWLIVGTDSGFEGITTLYYTQIDVLFNEMN